MEEQSIVSALLEAASLRRGEDTQRKIVIKRGGKSLFSFTVEAIDEDQYARCRRQSLKNRGKRNEEIDSARFLSAIIYEATCAEDKKKVWQNKDVWEKLNAVSGVDVVNFVLTPGEKTKIFSVIEEISGFNESDDLDDTIENF